MGQVPLGRPATYQDVIEQPDHVVAEILDGELYTSPRPSPRHAWAFSWLAGLLVPTYGRGGGDPGGWIVLGEPELHLGDDVLVPDLAGWRRDRMPRLPEAAYFELAPDWIGEVVSPSTVAIDRGRKLRIYAREAVEHAWLVDPVHRFLEVLERRGERWAILATHAGSDSVRVPPFDGIAIDLALLWSGSEE